MVQLTACPLNAQPRPVRSNLPARSRRVAALQPRRRRPVTAAAQQQGESQLTLRQGIWADAPTIFSAVLAEKMNPLVGLSPTRFLVAERRGSGGSGEVVGFGQTRPLQPGAVELLSLTVLPEHRGEGVGSALISALVAAAPAGHDIYLTTIGRRVALYERQGFKEVPQNEVPESMQFEVSAGTIVAKLAVNDRLVVMRRPGSGSAS